MEKMAIVGKYVFNFLIFQILGILIYIAFTSDHLFLLKWPIFIVVDVLTLMWMYKYGIQSGFVGGIILSLVTAIYCVNISKVNLGNNIELFLMLFSVFIAVVYKPGKVLFWLIVTVVSSIIAIYYMQLYLLFIPLMTIVVTLIVITLVNKTILEIKHVFASIKGLYQPLVTFFFIAFCIIFVFCCIYKTLYTLLPVDTYCNIPIEVQTNNIRLLWSFFYQSLMIFSTFDPPYPSGEWIVQIVVSIEVLISFLTLALYINLLFRSFDIKTK